MDKVFGENSKLPQLDFCCCGFPLRVGTLIIGWMTLAAGLVAMLICLNVGVNPLTGTEGHTTPYSCEYLSTGRTCYPGRIDTIRIDGSNGYRINTVVYRSPILFMLGIVAAIILIAGIHMKRANFLLPLMLLMIVSAIYGTYIVLLTCFSSEPTELTLFLRCIHEGGLLAMWLFSILLASYFLAVVNAYYTVLTKIPELPSYTATAPAANFVHGTKSFESV